MAPKDFSGRTGSCTGSVCCLLLVANQYSFSLPACRFHALSLGLGKDPHFTSLQRLLSLSRCQADPSLAHCFIRRHPVQVT